jgi:hypothetical protein
MLSYAACPSDARSWRPVDQRGSCPSPATAQPREADPRGTSGRRVPAGGLMMTLAPLRHSWRRTCRRARGGLAPPRRWRSAGQGGVTEADPGPRRDVAVQLVEIGLCQATGDLDAPRQPCWARRRRRGGGAHRRRPAPAPHPAAVAATPPPAAAARGHRPGRAPPTSPAARTAGETIGRDCRAIPAP